LLEWIPWLIILILLAALIALYARLSGLRRVFHAELSRRVAEIQLEVAEGARAKLEEERERLMKMFEQRFEEWKQRELESAVRIELEKWRREAEKEIRREAIKSSITTLLGKVGEQIAPLYMLRHLDIDPRDLRFIGTPVDYIAFKGLSAGSPEKILFIEVKASQAGALTERERHVKSLVESGKVEWVTFNIRKEIETAFQRIEKEIEEAESEPEREKLVEELCEPPLTQYESDEFYEWLANTFQITREEYDQLDEETRRLLREEYQYFRASTR